MDQLTFEQARAMTYEQLGAVEDPLDLQATGFVSTLLVRYMVRTSQIDRRYPGVPLSALLDALNLAAVRIAWPNAVGREAAAGKSDAAVEAYLDDVQRFVLAAL